MTTVHLLDAGLQGRIGHHFQMAAGFVQSFAKDGIECRVYAHRNVDADTRRLLHAIPVFSQDHYEFHSTDPWSGILEDMLEGGRRFAADLNQHLLRPPAEDDLVLLPTAGPRELGGLAQWLAQKGARPRIAAIFHGFVLPKAVLAPGSSSGAVYRYVGKMLQVLPGENRLVLAATTSGIGNPLRKAMGLRFLVPPAPIWYPGADVNGGIGIPGKGAPLQAAFIGQMRRDHGYDLVPGVVRALQTGKRKVRCVIQMGVVPADLDLAPYEELERKGQARLLRGWQEDDIIVDLLRESSVAVFPYSRDTYKARLSGALCTAAGYGRPCVVPSGTWLAQQVESGRVAGAVYEGDEPKAIAAAVRSVLADRDAQVKRALELALPWRAKESGGALTRGLVQWVRHDKGPVVAMKGSAGE